MSENLPLCYCTTVKKQLQAETLNQALNHLIAYNEMLQVGLENFKYVPQLEGHSERNNKLLSIYNCSGKSAAEIETLIEQIIKRLSGEMRPERGASIRAAFLKIDKDFSKLLLLSHRAIVDQSGLVLILEDLYRIYEQLSNGKKVALRPLRKTYQEFVKEVTGTKRKVADDLQLGNQPIHDREGSICETETGQEKVTTLSITLEKTLKRQLFSWRAAAFELTPAAAIAAGMLKSLAKASYVDAIGISIKSDYRFADETLKYTAGALTRIYMLPSEFMERHGYFSDNNKLRGIMHDISLHHIPQDSSYPTPQRSKSSSSDLQLFLNLEYLTADPWLGGDEWMPEGFIMTAKGRLKENYSIEVIPFFLSDGIKIVVEYRETLRVRMLVDLLFSNLTPDLDVILRYCEGYVGAKEFWVREFAKASTPIKFEVENDSRTLTEVGLASLRCEIEKSVLARSLLSSEAEWSELFLAAYSVLVSRLSGNEDIVLFCALAEPNTVFPLRLNPTWTSSFRLFIKQVKSKLRQASGLAQYVFDILSEEQQKHGRPFPAMNVGYSFKQIPANNGVEQQATDLLFRHPLFNQVSDFALEISEHDGELDISFVYEKSRFGAETIKRFCMYLNAILEGVAADTSIKLGDIQFDKDERVYEIAGSLNRDIFNL